MVILTTLAALVLLNNLSKIYFFRIDLTEDKRYSISEATKNLLADLDEVVYVEIYLDGDLPAGFKRMRTAIVETLEEFKIYSDNLVQYQFVNPESALSEKSRNEFLISIIRKGIQPTDVFLTENGNRIQKRIIPGVTIRYGGREAGVQLFKGNSTASPEVRLNQSIEGIEYELAQAIADITGSGQKRIGIVRGHKELDSLDFISFRSELERSYFVRDIFLNERIPNEDMLILAQPKTAFTTREKYNLDQFIMQGGKVLFMLDKLTANMDSANVGTYSFPYDLQLDDMLFRYGVRINNDLVLDFVSGTYPVVVGNSGDQPQIQLLQWPFYPVVNAFSDHVIVRNIDALLTRFVSSIDTVKAEGINKTVLFSSSGYSRINSAPVLVDVNTMRENIKPEYFPKQDIPLAYLLEGRFTSLYKNKFLPEFAQQEAFIDEGVENRIVVVADGDFARNEIDPRNGQPLPLGRPAFSRDGFTFANMDFLLNSINYLLEGDGLISARAKEVVIRPLNQVEVNANKTYWQVLNLVLPLVALLSLGVLLFLNRKRKFSRF